MLPKTPEARRRFIDKPRVVAMLYLFNPKDHKKEIANANEKHNGILKINTITINGKEKLFTRSVPVYSDQVNSAKNGTFNVSRTKDGEKVVAFVENDAKIKPVVKNTNTKSLQESLEFN